MTIKDVIQLARVKVIHNGEGLQKNTPNFSFHWRTHYYFFFIATLGNFLVRQLRAASYDKIHVIRLDNVKFLAKEADRAKGINTYSEEDKESRYFCMKLRRCSSATGFCSSTPYCSSQVWTLLRLQVPILISFWGFNFLSHGSQVRP